MSERETKEVKTRGGHTAVLKTYLTARERREVNNAIFPHINISVEGSTPKMDKITGEIASITEDETLRQTIVSLDGSTENILERLLDLPEDDFADIAKEVNQKEAEQEKKTE